MYKIDRRGGAKNRILGQTRKFPDVKFFWELYPHLISKFLAVMRMLTNYYLQIERWRIKMSSKK